MRAEWAGWRCRAFRKAVAKAEKEEGVCGIEGMRRKEGKRRAVEVSDVEEGASEERVVRTLLKGYMIHESARLKHCNLIVECMCIFELNCMHTSNAGPPLPISPLTPRMKSPPELGSSSSLLVQSSFPVHTTTCSVYAAMVFRSGVLWSISRSGGMGAHSHVGDGHDGVYDIRAAVVW